MILEKKQDKNTQMERCINIINNYFNTEIRIRSCKREIVEPRQIYYYLMVKNSHYNLTIISSYLGYNHATAIHSYKKIESLIGVEHQLKANVEKLDITFKKFFGIKVKTVKEILLEYNKYTYLISKENENNINNFLNINKYNDTYLHEQSKQV